MPAYVNSPFQVPLFVQKGVASYLFGSFDYKIGNSNLAVQSVAVQANVATVTALLLNGPAPVVGDLISIINTTTASGAFNVNRAVITSVVVNQATGVCAINFGLTTSNTANADSGTVICEPVEIPETLVAGASIACVFQAPESDSQFTIPVAATFPTMPTAATVSLQTAIHNIDSEFTTLGSPISVVAASAYTSGPVTEAPLQRGYFYRLIVSGITGTGTIVAKIGG